MREDAVTAVLPVKRVTYIGPVVTDWKPVDNKVDKKRSGKQAEAGCPERRYLRFVY